MAELKGKVEYYKDNAGEFRWRLVSSNGRSVASSGEGYSTFVKCQDGFEAVKRLSQDAVEVKTF